MPTLVEQLDLLERLAHDVLSTVESVRAAIGITNVQPVQNVQVPPKSSNAVVPPTSSTPPPTVYAPPVLPTEWPGPDSAEVRAVLDQVAHDAGMHPATLEAIERWETGNYTSKLFTSVWNPGGMKYRPELTLGHIFGSYTAADGNVYAKFPDWVRGIVAHGMFFKQTRYDGIRRTEDPRQEVQAIHAAGYAEYSEEWLNGVLSLVERVLARGGPGRDPRDMLSPHFSLAECEASKTAESQGISNRLPTQLRTTAIQVATQILEPIRELYGPFAPNSWYRSEALNSVTPGASPTSAHTQAAAVDLPRTDRMWAAIQGALPKMGPTLVQIEPTHYHLAISKTGAPEIRYINGATKETWE